MNDAKLLLAAILAAFLLLSPAAHNFAPTRADQKPNPPVETETLIGQQAPAMKMTYLNGQEVELQKFKGKTVVLCFWSTWSPACWNDIWFINELYTKNKDPNQIILAVTPILRERKKEEVERFITRRNLTLQAATCTTNILEEYKISQIPTVFIIDPNGKILCQETGPIREEEDFKENLDKVLETPKSPAVAD